MIQSPVLYCGLDLHKHFSYIVAKDGDGRQVVKGKVANSKDAIRSFFADIDGYTIKSVMEATSNYYWMHETLSEIGIRSKLAHPLKVKAIADARIKSDKIDAGILSDLLRADMIPESYIPDQRTRELREVLRHRMRLVSDRTQLKNRLRDVLTKNNCHESYADIAGAKARDFIDSLELKPVFKIQCNDILDHIDFIDNKIRSVNRLINKHAIEYTEVKRLTQIHGIGIFSALVLIAEIGDVTRFSSPQKLVKYAGLCPGLHQSGQTSYNTCITKEGNRYIRWVLCEAAQHAVRRPGALQDFYVSLAKTKGNQRAIVAVARKMLTGIYFVLKENRPFEPVRRKRYSYTVYNLDKPARQTGPIKVAGTIG